MAGGIGVPPVLCLAGKLAEQGVDVDVCLGFGTASKAVGVDEFRALGATVNVCTDDGTLGTHGFCTDPAAELLGEGIVTTDLEIASASYERQIDELWAELPALRSPAADGSPDQSAV